MGTTAGSAVMAAIAEDTGGNRLTRGVVFDATASEMVDASMDWIISYFARELRRENKALTENRFSAGYGDFLLENQQTIFRLLELERIGVQITASFVLIPEKSVTAIAGVKGK
jgi:cobalamin-dependent methionine synthase I